MQAHDDGQRLEVYLRTFRPLSPPPLPRREKHWTWFALSAAAAVAIALLVLAPPFRCVPSAPVTTIGAVNRCLADAASWTSVIDDGAFALRASSPQPIPPHRSALQLLSQEDFSR